MKYPLKILAVDDDAQLRKLIERGLEAYGYHVIAVDNGQQALALAAQQAPDVVILDINLRTETDGFDICRNLREWTTVPIIILSVQQEQQTKIAALDVGADDYMTKPFDMGELEARIRAVLRRSIFNAVGIPKGEVHIHELMIDLVKRRVTLKGEEVHLTPKEYELLRLLVTNAGKVMTYKMLLEAVWGQKQVNADHYVRVYMNTIRKKLSDDLIGNTRYIITEPGIGYRFTDLR